MHQWASVNYAFNILIYKVVLLWRGNFPTNPHNTHPVVHLWYGILCFAALVELNRVISLPYCCISIAEPSVIEVYTIWYRWSKGHKSGKFPSVLVEAHSPMQMESWNKNWNRWLQNMILAATQHIQYYFVKVQGSNMLILSFYHIHMFDSIDYCEFDIRTRCSFRWQNRGSWNFNGNVNLDLWRLSFDSFNTDV